MSRRRSAAGPIVVAAVAALLAVAGLVVALGADHGPPPARSFDLAVAVPSGRDVPIGSAVRLDGVRIGRVAGIAPTMDPRSGRIHATLKLALRRSAGPVPRDTAVVVRPRSLLGPRDVELVRGRSPDVVPAGGTLPLTQARIAPVDPAPAIAGADDRTRRAALRSTRELANGLTGREAELGTSVARLGLLLERLSPVARGLADRRTALTPTIGLLARTAREVAPVAPAQAPLLRRLNGTLSALGGVADPKLQDAISTAVPLQGSVDRRLPATTALLRRTRRLLNDLRPGLRALRATAPELATTFARGTRTLPRLSQLTTRLTGALEAGDELATDPLTTRSLDAQARAATVSGPVLEQLASAQVTCNAITLLGRNVASHLSEGNRYGTWARVLLVLAPLQTFAGSRPAANLNVDPYPNAGQPGAPAECESGNEPFSPSGRIGNVPGNQGTVVDRRPGARR